MPIELAADIKDSKLRKEKIRMLLGSSDINPYNRADPKLIDIEIELLKKYPELKGK